MAKTLDSTSQRMSFQSGSTILLLDKSEGRATMQRKLLLWRLKPMEAALADIKEVTVNKMVDRGSGVEVRTTMLLLNTGKAWALPASDGEGRGDHCKGDASFLGASIIMQANQSQ